MDQFLPCGLQVVEKQLIKLNFIDNLTRCHDFYFKDTNDMVIAL